MTFKRGGVTIGVVFFPSIPPRQEVPAATAQAVIAAAKALAPQVQLLVGVSPWGLGPEERFHITTPEDPFHIILGTGEGVGLAGRLVNDSRTLWMRTYERGKAVLRVDILALPEKTPGWMWMPGANIQYRPQTVLDTLAVDQEMFKLFERFPQEAPREDVKAPAGQGPVVQPPAATPPAKP